MIGAVTSKVNRIPNTREIILDPRQSGFNSSLNSVEQRVQKRSKCCNCHWGYYVIVPVVVIFVGIGTLLGYYLNHYVIENHETGSEPLARHIGCEDWRLINNSICEIHLMNDTNCLNDRWDCQENKAKEKIAREVCELMIDCCDFVKFTGSCKSVDYSYSWNFLMKDMEAGLEGWKECKKSLNMKWNLCTQI